MKRESAKRLVGKHLTMLLAFAKGEKVEHLDHQGRWKPVEYFNFQEFEDSHELRIAPTPQFRPWTAEEFPMPCVVRSKECPTSRWTVLSVSKHGVGTSDCTGILKDIGVATFELLFRHNEHSTDGCATWQPCGVQINGGVYECD